MFYIGPAKNFVSETSPWRDYFKKQNFFAETKKQIFFLQEPKLKRGIFARTNAIFKPKKIGISYKIKLTVNIII